MNSDTINLERLRELQRTYFPVCHAHRPHGSPRVTVEISPKGKGCELTLIHEGVPPEAKQRSSDGWHKILDQLERQLGRD
jgi:hypothetical protein